MKNQYSSYENGAMKLIQRVEINLPDVSHIIRFR